MKVKNLYRNYKYLKAEGLSLSQKISLVKRERYHAFEMKFFGKTITVPDAGSFKGVYEELFVDNLYKFTPKSTAPVIIDCGSNVGLSIIYFKLNYPNSKILAYEADPDLAEILKSNVAAFGFDGVDIHAKAIWINDEFIEFVQEGGASGMISAVPMEGKKIKIPTVRLKTLLEQQEQVDFLKIDIEGAEYEVLKDCADSLGAVEHIFIEYHSMHKKEQHLGDILLLLKKAGFRYHLTEAFVAEQPFVERKNMLGMDLLVNVFAYKE